MRLDWRGAAPNERAEREDQGLGAWLRRAASLARGAEREATTDGAGPTPGPSGATLDEVRARAVRYPLGSGQAEELALFAGLKPALRQLLRREDARRQAEVFRARGLAADVYEIPAGLLQGDEGGWVLLLVAATQTTLVRMAQAERARDCARLGALLGFPRCCVDAFVSCPAPRDEQTLAARAARRTAGVGSPLLDALHFGVFHYVSWTPCHFRCRASLAYAEEVDTLLAPHRSFLDELHPALARHRLLLSPAVQLSLEATPCVGGWAIAKVDPTLRWAHPDVVLSASDERDTALALEVCRRASTLSVEPDGALLLDGRRWRKGLFVPFGETPRTAPRRPRVGSPEP